jgi:drug/metabolite transporter (DMT)-like permease
VTVNTAKHKRAYFYASLAVLLWSTIAAAFKISLRYSDVLPLLFFASIISTAFFLVFLLVFKKITLLRTLSKQDYLRSAILGFTNPFLYYMVLLKAYSILTAQEAMTINWTWPITLVLLSILLLKQKIHLRSILAIVISFAGVFVIATRGDILSFRFTSPKGVFLALGSTLIWSVWWVYNIKDKCEDHVRLFLNFAFGSFFMLLLMLLFTGIQIPSRNTILGAIYIGLCEMGFTFLIWLKALKSAISTAHVANLIHLVPFLSLIVIHFALGEAIYLSTILGLVLIVTGIAFQKLWG